MKRYPYRTAEKIMWVGNILLFVACLAVSWTWGFLAQLPLLVILACWGFFVRRYLSLS